MRKVCGLQWRESYTTSLIERVLFFKNIILIWRNETQYLQKIWDINKNWKLNYFLQSQIKGMMLWLDIYSKENLVALSNLYRFSFF